MPICYMLLCIWYANDLRWWSGCLWRSVYPSRPCLDIGEYQNMANHIISIYGLNIWRPCIQPNTIPFEGSSNSEVRFAIFSWGRPARLFNIAILEQQIWHQLVELEVYSVVVQSVCHTFPSYMIDVPTLIYTMRVEWSMDPRGFRQDQQYWGRHFLMITVPNQRIWLS